MDTKYEAILKEFEAIEEKLQNPEITSTPNLYGQLSQKHAQLSTLASLIKDLKRVKTEISQNKEILTLEEDQEFRELATKELEELNTKKEHLETTLKEQSATKDPDDIRDAIIEIRAGTGGEEAALFASDLFRMYQKYAESQGLKFSLLSAHYTGNGGFKEAIIMIKGQSAYGQLKFESGVHRVQRVPQTESAGRIHTSAASVVVLPEVDDLPDVEIKEEDIKIDTYRSTGPGGQSVNTTDSAVRITHLPTNLIVTCQDEKSQHKNKARAMSILKSKLYQIEQEKIATKTDSTRRNAIKSGDRSAKIRTYNFPQGRVTDHRIKVTWHNLQSILDGNLAELISTTKQKLLDANVT